MAIRYGDPMGDDAAIKALHKALGKWLRTDRAKDAETRAEALRVIDTLLDPARLDLNDAKREAILELRAAGLTNRQVADLMGYASISRLDQLLKGTRNATQSPVRHPGTVAERP